MITKGEWKVEDKTQVVVGDRLIANTGGYSSNVKPARPENIANAHLIAAAPELYEACTVALGILTSIDTPHTKARDEVSVILREALAKADDKGR